MMMMIVRVTNLFPYTYPLRPWRGVEKGLYICRFTLIDESGLLEWRELTVSIGRAKESIYG